MLGLFKRRKAEPQAVEALPLSVEFALGGLSVMSRPDAEGNPRVLLQWTGNATVAWYHEEAETRRRLALAFPSLTSGQLDLALRAVAGLVRAAQAETGTGPAKHRSEWASWAPARRLTELPGLPHPMNF